MKYDTLATTEQIERTIAALKENGIEAILAADGQAAKKKALEMIPAGAEVMNMTSVTLDTIGLAEEINQSDKFNSVRKKLSSMDKAKDGLMMQKLGAAPAWAVGSVHAVTEDGKIMIASNSGSQLPAYAYGSSRVIWIVGAQKIVKNTDEGLKRIYEYVLPLESERAKKAYGVPGSNVSKILIINKEISPGRITLIIVNEVLGF